MLQLKFTDRESAKIVLKEILQETLQESVLIPQKTSGEDEVLDIHAVAKLLYTTPETVKDWNQAGKIPSLKPGKNLLFLRSEIIEWIKSHRKNNLA